MIVERVRPNECRDLVALLRQRAQDRPDVGFTFLHDGEAQAEELSYAELDQRARALAARLRHAGAAGERVLLLLPQGLDFIAAFFGCLYAGAVAVPAYPPRLHRPDARLRAIAGDCAPRAVLTTAATLSRAAALREQVPALDGASWLAVDAADGTPPLDEVTAPGGDALAFLQYTSGSTGTPKGVRVSHGNLLHNEEMIRRAFGQSAGSRIVGWLPLFHDMGLIGNVLQPLYLGAPAVLMSPAAFLQRPLRWLRAISRYQATTSGGPDFAYQLCVQRASEADLAGLDLSCWEVAFSGAEPVRAETLERFARVFAPAGFRPRAFYPCYGLAEATLFVAGGQPGEGARIQDIDPAALERNVVAPATAERSRGLVSCGGPWLGQELEIVDPETLEACPPGRIGEIWVAGPSVAGGYWGRPEETESTFNAYRRDGRGPFLRTGDLGARLGEELFITGRLKDLIILRGRNLYPQDVERTAEASHPAFRAAASAAFPVEAGGEERLVVVQEVERSERFRVDVEVAAAALRRAVAEEHEAQVHEVVLIATGSIPKTSSGKIQRRACRQAYLDGSLEVLGRSLAGAGQDEPAPAGTGAGREDLLALEPAARRDALLAYLSGRIAKLAGAPVAAGDLERPLSSLGLDSLAAVELSNDLESDLGASVPLSELLESASIRELAEVLAKRLGQTLGRSGIAPLPPEEAFLPRPLSPGQRGLWLLEGLSGGSGVGNLGGAARVRGRLDAGAFREALRRLSLRHPALRLTFGERAGVPWQQAHERLDPAFEAVNAAGWSASELRARLQEEIHRPFDLAGGPPVRVVLWSGAAGDVLSLAVHHLVADLWSLTVMVRDLGALYGLASGQGGDDPPLLEVSPLDVYAFQERRLAGPEGERLWDYWRRQLADPPPTSELPADRPRQATRTFSGGAVTSRVPAKLAGRLGALGRERGATPFMVLLSALQALLHRHTGQEDLVVGAPTTGRGLARMAPLVGYFVNLVALRASVAGEDSFATRLDHTRETALEAFAHEDYPFPLLAERLQPERDPGRSPLFQVVFAFQKPHLGRLAGLAAATLGEDRAEIDLGALVLESLGLPTRAVQFDLTMMAAERDGGLGISFQYDAALFDEATMARLAARFGRLLEGIAEEPGRPLADLPLLPVSESRQLLLEWSGVAGSDRAPGIPVHLQVAAWAARTPTAPAVVEETGALTTYGELGARAGRLARRLLASGVGAEDVVALLLPRSADLVVAQLAVLSAGASFLPIDPAYPPERQSFLLTDSGARALVTRGGGAPAGVDVAVIDLDGEDPTPGEVLESPAAVDPDRRAYVIYTSGSTGVPKGVEVPHRGLAALVSWHGEAYGSAAAARATLVASPAFDASVWEIWSALAAGASLHVVPDALRSAPAPLADWLVESGITLSFLPTPLAEALLAEPRRGLALRWLLTGGDRLTRRPPPEAPFVLVNHYGPTESSVVATAARVESVAAGAPAIGRPIPGTRSYVLVGGRPVPPGVPGELHLGGDGLARGYLGRPDLTAEGFVPDAFSGRPGARLYRTGDRVRHGAGGELEFLGRTDDRVKVRGFRIEPGEIENVLGRAPGVTTAAVVAREEGPGDHFLAAYVTGPGGAEPAALRAFLRERLPEHMVPAVFVALPELPLTVHGKLDRRALPAPERGAGTHRAPSSPLEELLAGIWSEVLDRETVGADDDFLALGGHSLLAARAASRVRALTGVDLPLRSLFEHPTLAGLARRIEELRGTGEEAGPALVPAADPADREDSPLSFSQERLWFLDQLEPGLAVYNIPVALRLTGPLSPPALEAAVRAVAGRHEALRTTFEEVDGRPAQHVHPEPELRLERLDLRRCPQPARQSELERVLAAEARRPFDLQRGPLFRAALVQLAEEEHVLLLSLHHIVADGWSIGVLVGDLAELYGAALANRSASLPPLPVQFADFARWQRRWLDGPALASRLAFWRVALAGAPTALDLPTDRPRPARPTYRGAEEPFRLSASLCEELRAVGARRGATLFMTVLAAFQVLLARHGRQSEVLVGSPVANRERPELEGLVGFFVNTVVLRGDLRGEPDFAALLDRTRAVALAAFEHQDLPFEKLVEELAPERELGRNPLFQAMLALHSPPAEPVLPGVRMERVPVSAGASRFDLTLSLLEREGGLEGGLEHSLDLFDGATVQGFLGRLETLLLAVAAGRPEPVSELPLLTGAEEAQLLGEWADGGAIPAVEGGLHELFLLQAARTPDAVALLWAGEALTYRELRRRSGRLARRLAAEGVGPETRVGVCLERTPDLIAALLGVLEAGGAYVPLDPAYPQDRLAFMLEDSGASLALARGALGEALRGTGIRVLELEAGWADADEPSPDAPPVRPAGSGNLAYLIYTSGSTGRPKGVAIEHAAAVTFVRWARTVFGPESLSGVLASTSVCFDLSVFEIFVPLSWGGRAILVDNALALPGDPAAGEVTLLNTVPSAAAELVRMGLPPSVRTVNLAGEPLPRSLARQLYGTGTVERVFDLYGPSEDTTYSTFSLVDREGDGSPAIGRPLPGSQAYVLDAAGRLAPPGVPGELQLGGAGLARGYLGRPELTAERFVPDPFAAEPGRRLYRTGDLVRHLRAGGLDFFGRIDHQVKIRGFRIEPGEIEDALRRCPGLAEAVVTAREDRPGERYLAAYVVGVAAERPAEIRAFLRGRLPEHMIPAAFVALPALPLTPNGKLDRRALPAPDLAAGVAAGAQPRNPTEEVLAGLWADALGRRQVGIHDDFFALGGHSLLATRLISRVRRAFGVELPVRAVFESPTVAAMAVAVSAAVAAARGEAGPEAPPPLRRRSWMATPPLSAAQRRLWFLDRLDPESAAYYIAQSLRITGPLSIPALAASLAGLVGRHEALRTRFELDATGEPVQRIAPASSPDLPVVDLAALPQDRRGSLASTLLREAARRPFNLETGPLLRALLLRSGADEHEILLALHHIVADGWSMGIVVREVAAEYAARLLGREPELPEPPVQYADYALWQEEWLNRGAVERDLAYWRQRLEGAPDVLDLPTDFPRPAVRSGRGGEQPFALGPTLSASVRDLARRREATPFMVLLAALQVLLSRYAHSLDISVGTPVAGRRALETEGVVGLFVNTLVVRTNLTGEPGFEELLRRVRTASLADYEHQEIPFERLVAELAPVRDLASSPLFQVLFTLQNAPMGRLELPGLTLEPRDVDLGAAKLDLSLNLAETAEGFAGRVVYDSGLFLPGTIERFRGHLSSLLTAAMAEPDRPVSDLPLLSAVELAQILGDWSATAPGPAWTAPVHERFAAWAHRNPGAPAVVCEGGALTAGELELEASRLARHLRSLGVGADVPVALFTGRSPALLVGLLAILKAGGAYVPLDESFPAERLAYVLAETGAPVALTEAHLADRLAGLAPDLQILRIDADRDLFAGAGSSLPLEMAPESLAYIIFTSGSTGRPKGVAVEHRQLSNYVDGVIERLDLPAGASYATVSTLAADLGNTMIFPALVQGGCLHVIAPERASDAEAFADYMERHGIDCLKIVPSHLAALQTAERPERGLPRRRLVLGGEASTREMVSRLRERAPTCRVFNHYGPTETTVGVAVQPVESAAGHGVTIPLGRPLPGSRLFLLDERSRPVPAGVPGELYIGGAGVARGYFRRPDLTAERFVPAPVAGLEPGARLYRTGDLARFLPDGSVEFLGRADQQVKIRGFRIEPAEIAASLQRHPAVREAFVAALPDAGGPRLAAWVALAPGSGPVELRTWLRHQLPEYMIPAILTEVAGIPHTANGKVDLRSLPSPEAPAREEGGRGPATPTEEALAAVWRELLDISRIDRSDDFFTSGGHSLLATRLASRLRQTFQVDIPLRSVFQYPTLQGLAARIEAARREARGLLAPPIVAGHPEVHPPLSFAQERLWFLEQIDPGKPVYNLPYFARVTGALRPEILAASLREVLRRHEVLRAGFTAGADGAPVQTLATAAAPRVSMVSLEALPEERRRPEADRLATAEARRPFDLGHAPLLRSTLLRLDREEHVLLLTLHHIVSDAWSRGLLAGEIAALYGALAAGAPSPLPELPLQYADFARWQRDWLRGEPLDRLLAYWRGRLDGETAALQLPTDRPRPAVRTSRGGALSFRLSGGEAEGTRNLARSEGSTLFMVFQAAFASLLHRFSHQERIVLGSPIANRNRAEIEPLIGFFVNTLAVPVSFAGGPSFRQLLSRVRQEDLGAYEHQDLPFERLVEEIVEDRSLGRPPLFQAVIQLQDGSLPSFAGTGLEWAPLKVHSGTAKFDLTLAMTDDGRELAGALEYDADLFEPATATRLLDSFRTLLAAAVAGPEGSVAALPMLSEAERFQLLVEWNAAPLERGGPFLHEAFVAQAARTPEAIALYDGTQRLTYAELAGRVDRLARRLRRLGVGPEVRVGVFLHRSADLLVGLLGILQAGGAYVPLDPAYPAERVAFMLEDAGASAILVHQSLRARLPDGADGLPTLVLDAPDEDRDGAVEPPPSRVLPENLAYLIYTSGSTGRPKAVAIRHDSAAALLRWAADAFSDEEIAGVLASTSICFDMSVFELFAPLARGGALILAENALALATLPERDRVTLVDTVP
ncbi:MAG TPA: non-ribosomal peptide synthase/polyketide synthase, partial [Thermoanaerobaculia bacterium]|nr:non-ribosomal peptide synthase/polyketide synthase [Thermoanaerobaculia bacterium]